MCEPHSQTAREWRQQGPGVQQRGRSPGDFLQGLSDVYVYRKWDFFSTKKLGIQDICLVSNHFAELLNRALSSHVLSFNRVIFAPPCDAPVTSVPCVLALARTAGVVSGGQEEAAFLSWSSF